MYHVMGIGFCCLGLAVVLGAAVSVITMLSASLTLQLSFSVELFEVSLEGY